ncbi:MAG: transposase [Thaumarchaeota archaeon]|nr:transposase [Nitrososphaerota archaeon]
MCNDAIRIAIKSDPKNRFALIKLAYKSLKGYGLHSHYVLSACEVAFSAYKNKNRKGVPQIRSAFFKLDRQVYQLNHLLLRIPTTPRQFIFLVLDGSKYHLSFVNDPTLKTGPLTITEHHVSISFSKGVTRFEPEGFMGIDVNERNATVSSTNGHFRRFTELGEVVEIKERYREIRAKVARVTRQDKRIGKGLLAKYGRRERNRTVQRIHRVSKQIVDYAKEHKFGIIMEDLKGIRKHYRKGNKQGSQFKARMNTWVFGETQRQTDYKANWEGIPDWFVDPRGTSSKCPCGSRVVPLQDRKLYCPKCDRTWDRDDLASKNIMACAVPQARPFKRSDDGERGAGGSNPQSRWREG